MDFRPTDDQTLLRRTVREFAETEIRPHIREWDEEQHFASELIPKMAAQVDKSAPGGADVKSWKY